MQVHYTPKLHFGVSPLAEYWPYGPAHFRGARIALLPTGFIEKALVALPRLPRPVRGALIAEHGLRVMAADQREGR